MKKLLILSTFLVSSTLLAGTRIPLEQQIATFTVEEVSANGFLILGSVDNQKSGQTGGVTGAPLPEVPSTPTAKPTFGDRVEQVGKVIGTAKDMVALGESIYELVKKGRPSNTTEYAPISVVPRDPMTKEIADVFDLEGFSMPVEKNFIARLKNGSGKEVITFAYRVMYSYGGSYNGTGKYLTNVIVVPGSIKTSYGWDFNATMKLSGIMNHGTKADPVAGVMVTVKYQMNSWSAAYERNDTIHITGRGEFKNHMVQ